MPCGTDVGGCPGLGNIASSGASVWAQVDELALSPNRRAL